MHVGGECAEGRGKTADNDGCTETYFYDCNINEPMPTVPKRFVKYSEPLTVEKLTAAGWSYKLNEDTNIYACSIDTPHLILFVGLGKDYTHFFIISKFNLKKGERVEMFIPQKIDIELYKVLTVGEFNSLLEISGFVKFKI